MVSILLSLILLNNELKMICWCWEKNDNCARTLRQLEGAPLLLLHLGLALHLPTSPPLQLGLHLLLQLHLASKPMRTQHYPWSHCFWCIHKSPPYHLLFPNSGFPCPLGPNFPSVGLGRFSRGVLPGLVRAGYCHNEPNKGVRAQWWRRARLTHHHWPARAARPASATHHCHQKHPRALIGQEALWARRAWLARPIGRERRTAAASMLSCNDFAPEEDLGSLNAHPPLPSIHF